MHMYHKSLMTFKSRLKAYLACLPYLFCRFLCPFVHWKNRGKTRVLVFHHLDKPALFEKTLYALARHYHLISFNQYLRNEKSPDKINVILAFDDGYRSWFEHGLRLLRTYHICPLLFINSDFIGLDTAAAHHYCHNAITTWPEASLSWQELKALAEAGAEIGGHALGHRDLTATEPESAVMDAIASDRAAIQLSLGNNIRSFAYPFGRYNSTSIRCVEKAGYSYGFSSDSGFLDDSTSPFILKRTNVGMRPPLVALAMAEGWNDWLSDIVCTFKKMIAR